MPNLKIGSATLTAPGENGAADIASLPGQYVLRLDIQELKAGSGTPAARILIEDSIDAFTADSLAIAVADVRGPIVPGATVTLSWQKRELPSIRVGIANAEIRARVIRLDGNQPSITAVCSLAT